MQTYRSCVELFRFVGFRDLRNQRRLSNGVEQILRGRVRTVNEEPAIAIAKRPGRAAANCSAAEGAGRDLKTRADVWRDSAGLRASCKPCIHCHTLHSDHVQPKSLPHFMGRASPAIAEPATLARTTQAQRLPRPQSGTTPRRFAVDKHFPLSTPVPCVRAGGTNNMEGLSSASSDPDRIAMSNGPCCVGVAIRYTVAPTIRSSDFGFRLALSSPSAQSPEADK